jgi:U3 small nucleolar ribonucleoprotein component
MGREAMTSILAELQQIRTENADNRAVYWALTIAIDYVLGLGKEDIEMDIERLRRAAKR